MGDERLSFSCYQCRSRKLKCDRTRPCTRCVKSGENCRYPERRKKPEILASRPKVKDLESRLKELEQRLSTTTSPPGAPVQEPSPPDSDSLLHTGRFERLPPQDAMDELVDVYFARIHCDAPMIHEARYRASLLNPPARQPPMCLQYAIWALAASLTPDYQDVADMYYRRSRTYVEADEMRTSGQDFITLSHAQCWALLSRYEAHVMCFSRTAMSCSRAVRVAQILGLDKLDFKAGSSHTVLPASRDFCELEERRRTFWLIFYLDRFTSATTEWPLLVDWKQIRTRLPASEEAFQAGFEELTPTLREGLRNNTGNTSPFACRLLAMHLFQQCTNLNTTATDPDELEATDDTYFWKHFVDLDNAVTLAFANMPPRLHCPPNVNSLDAVIVNTLLHTAAICLHRVGNARAVSSSHSGILPKSEKILPAAHSIFDTIAGLTNLDLLFNNPFLAFASFMAALVLLEDYVATQNPESDARLSVLMDAMVAIGTHNPYTASLVVQLAFNLHASGTDKTALEKVAPLMEKLNMDAPLLAEGDQKTGVVIFCPFEQVRDPPEGKFPSATGLERQFRGVIERGQQKHTDPPVQTQEAWAMDGAFGFR